MALDQPCFDCVHDLVRYRSFHGNEYELRRYFGKHVVLLLPDDWGHDRGLGEEERRVLLDDADLIYEYLNRIRGDEPEGEGFLTIAFVDDGYWNPWAWRGSRRIEFRNDMRNLELLRRGQSQGVAYWPLVTELTRSFAKHWGYYAWIDLVAFNVSHYSRTPRSGLTADEQLRAMVQHGFMPYVWDLSASWQEHRYGEHPVSSNELWAGLSYLVGLHHGSESMLGSISYIIELLSNVSMSELDMGDVYVESLAYGAQVDLSCYLDILRWYGSDELRDRMSATYSIESPLCADADSDSFTIIEGDCNDGSRDVRPHEIETADGVDEDCDGVVDDLVLNEPVRDDFVEPVPVTVPMHIFGRVDQSETADVFELDVDSGTILQLELCNEHRNAVELRLVKDGVTSCDGSRWSRFGCQIWRNEFTEPGTWYLEARKPYRYANDSYSLLIHETELPEPFWSRVEAEKVSAGSYLVTARSNPQLTEAPASTDMVRFWVSGFGFIADVPWQPVVSYEWQPEVELEDGVYSVRAQVYRDDRPFLEMSERAFLGRPMPDFTWSFAGPPGKEGQVVRLDDRSQRSPQALTWRIGDAVISGEPSILHTFRAGQHEVTLEATNSFGVAERTRLITIAGREPMTVRVTATILSTSRLSLRGNTARWRLLEEEPDWEYGTQVVINETRWYPTWPLNDICEYHGESEVFDEVEPPLAALPATSVAITEITRGRNVTVVEEPSAENDYTLMLELTPPLDGSGTVDFKARIKWQQPSPRRGQRHP